MSPPDWWNDTYLSLALPMAALHNTPRHSRESDYMVFCAAPLCNADSILACFFTSLFLILYYFWNDDCFIFQNFFFFFFFDPCSYPCGFWAKKFQEELCSIVSPHYILACHSKFLILTNMIRSMIRYVIRSIFRSVIRSVIRSVFRSVIQSVIWSMIRSVIRSVIWSVIRSVIRSVIKSGPIQILLTPQKWKKIQV